MLLAPPWARTSHVVQFWPVRVDAMAPELEPGLDQASAQTRQASIQLATAPARNDPLKTCAMD